APTSISQTGSPAILFAATAPSTTSTGAGSGKCSHRWNAPKSWSMGLASPPPFRGASTTGACPPLDTCLARASELLLLLWVATSHSLSRALRSLPFPPGRLFAFLQHVALRRRG